LLLLLSYFGPYHTLTCHVFCPKGGAGSGLRAAVSKLVPMAQVAYIRLVRGWEPKEMSAVTMLFEGSGQEVAAQRREVRVL
ncbi:unnamed protein product, partial [Laminaria digitata]